MPTLRTFLNSLGLRRSGSCDSESDPVKSDVVRGGQEAAAEVQQEASAKLLPSNVVSYRNFKTACLFYSSLSTGLCTPVLGYTLVHVELLFGVSTAISSLGFTVQAIGGVFGAVLCGLVFDHVNPELAFAVASFFQGMSYIVAPYMGGVVPFTIAMGIQTTATSFIGTGIIPYCIGLWTGHQYSHPILHTTNAIWSLGGIVSPFIIAPFLVDLPPQQLSASATPNWLKSPFVFEKNQDTTSIASASYESTRQLVSEPFWNVTSVNASAFPQQIGPSDVADVRYAYVTIGSLGLLSLILFVIGYLLDRFKREGRSSETSPSSNSSKHSTNQKTSKESNIDDQASKHSPKCSENYSADTSTNRDFERLDMYFYMIFVALAFFFYHFQRYGVTGLMTAFVVKYLHFSVQSAALLTSLLFAFQFAGRVIGIPVAAYIRPQTMLIFNLSSTAFLHVLLLVLVDVWPTIVWITIPLGSLTVATTFAAGMLWISDRVKLTGRLSGITLIGHSSGAVVSSLVVGQLFERSTPLWFVISNTASSIIKLVWFLILMGYYARYGDRVVRHSNASLRGHSDEQVDPMKKSGYKSVDERDDGLELITNIETNELDKFPSQNAK